MIVFYKDSDPATANTIPGPHEEPVVQSPKMNKKVNHFWGLVGSSVLVSQPGVRQISVTMWFNDWNWVNIGYVFQNLDLLDKNFVGEPGTLEITTDTDGYWPASNYQKYAGVVFDGYRQLPFRGQDEPRPIVDSAATIYHFGPHAGNVTWLIKLQLLFTQAIADRVLTP